MKKIVNCAASIFAYCAVVLFFQDVSFAQNANRPNINLYFFTNPACGPCRQVEPVIEQLAHQGYPVTTINTNAQPNWVQHFNVQVTPTVVMVAEGRVVNRQTGMIDGRTLRNWFAAAKSSVGARTMASKNRPVSRTQTPSPQQLSPARWQSLPNSQTNQRADTGIRTVAAFENTKAVSRSLPATVHQGTRRARTPAERRALQATVRLRVTDPLGSSFATGTVVHSHQGESLVLTCGHVFRDSNGQGTITAEFGFNEGQIKKAAGTLISYDAENRDVALVAIRTGNWKVDPITIAQDSYPVQRSDEMFSIGCDKGQDPTIRRTRIKNLAMYNGVNKYDIYGRPVDGRSGGGLFTPGGQLVGVCNARVVEEDEGVYVALDTIYWQIARVNLLHIFKGNHAIAANIDLAPEVGQPRLSRGGSTRFESDVAVSAQPNPVQPAVHFPSRSGPSAQNDSEITLAVNQERRQINQNNDSFEMIVIMRSKADPKRSETITINNPSPQLLNQLRNANRRKNDNRMATLRRQMPQIDSNSSDSREQMRAQSPR